VTLGALLIALSYGAYALSFRARPDPDRGTLGEYYGVTLFLLAALAVATGIQAGARALRSQLRERWESQVQQQHPAVYTAIREILERHDPAQVRIPDGPLEFDLQARRVLTLVIACPSRADLAIALHDQFVHWFGRRAGARHLYEPLAQELWNAWQLARGYKPG
jgi:hypothetical protein